MEEHHEEQNRDQENEVEKDVVSPKRKRKKTRTSLKKVKDGYDVNKHKQIMRWGKSYH